MLTCIRVVLPYEDIFGATGKQVHEKEHRISQSDVRRAVESLQKDTLAIGFAEFYDDSFSVYYLYAAPKGEFMTCTREKGRMKDDYRETSLKDFTERMVTMLK